MYSYRVDFIVTYRGVFCDSSAYFYDNSLLKHVTPFYHYYNGIKNMCIIDLQNSWYRVQTYVRLTYPLIIVEEM